MSASLDKHEQYGENSTIVRCPYCLKPKGVMLLGSFIDGKAPKYVTDGFNPCDECAKKQEGALIVIGMRQINKDMFNMEGYAYIFGEENKKSFLNGLDISEEEQKEIIKNKYFPVPIELLLKLNNFKLKEI